MGVNVAAATFVGMAPTIGPLLAAPWMFGALAVATRRLHDMRRSGWWLVAPVVAGLPILALFPILGNGPAPPGWAGVIDALAIFWLVSSLVFLIWIAFAPSTREPNCYGEADTMLA
jgi:uncharacterized membrane protein YhaH (DUF805 family)